MADTSRNPGEHGADFSDAHESTGEHLEAMASLAKIRDIGRGGFGKFLAGLGLAASVSCGTGEAASEQNADAAGNSNGNELSNTPAFGELDTIMADKRGIKLSGKANGQIVKIFLTLRGKDGSVLETTSREVGPEGYDVNWQFQSANDGKNVEVLDSRGKGYVIELEDSSSIPDMPDMPDMPSQP